MNVYRVRQHPLSRLDTVSTTHVVDIIMPPINKGMHERLSLALIRTSPKPNFQIQPLAIRPRLLHKRTRKIVRDIGDIVP